MYISVFIVTGSVKDMGYKRKQTRKRFVLQTTNDWFFYNIYKVFFVLLHALRTRAYRGAFFSIARVANARVLGVANARVLGVDSRLSG